MATGLPSQTQVIELLDAEFARAGYEIEDVVIDERSRPPRITVIADGDTALDLDTVAELSRSASNLLDAERDIGGTYVLEVSSPGVDRPLTSEKHFRRARGRKVDLTLDRRDRVNGRVGETRDGVVHVWLFATAGRLEERPISTRRRHQSCCPGRVFAASARRAGPGAGRPGRSERRGGGQNMNPPATMGRAVRSGTGERSGA